MPNILVTGGSGQLAKAIEWAAAGSPNNYILATHDELDICDCDSIGDYIRQNDIRWVVNTAAYTNVDGAEDNVPMAQAINCDAVRRMATICKEHNVGFLHISTDYVFGGDATRNAPYTENDTPAPINVYGRTKADGEMGVVESGGIVIRTSWLYSPWAKNFVLTILRLAREHDSISVVDDQRGTPTSALGLAEAVVAIIDNHAIESMSDIYHYTDIGDCSWYDFAKEIIAIAGIAGCEIVPCKSSERAMRAMRPTYSVLDTRRIATIEGVSLQHRTKRLEEAIRLI